MGRGALQADELEILKELLHHQNIVRFFSSWSALSWALCQRYFGAILLPDGVCCRLGNRHACADHESLKLDAVCDAVKTLQFLPTFCPTVCACS